MEPDWKQAEPALRHIRIKGNSGNRLVTVSGHAEHLRCIGIGTDAAVFVYDPLPGYAFKVYADEALRKRDEEEQVYLALGHSPYFPVYYGKGDRYIVISLEQGPTLYDCLAQGIEIPRRVLEDVEEARRYARSKGLNPRDIHLKNVLMQDGRAKLLDVSEYRKPGNDRRWEHLLLAYRLVYRWLKGRKLSVRQMEAVKNLYLALYGCGMKTSRLCGRFSRKRFARRQAPESGPEKD